MHASRSALCSGPTPLRSLIRMEAIQCHALPTPNCHPSEAWVHRDTEGTWLESSVGVQQDHMLCVTLWSHCANGRGVRTWNVRPGNDTHTCCHSLCVHPNSDRGSWTLCCDALLPCTRGHSRVGRARQGRAKLDTAKGVWPWAGLSCVILCYVIL